MQQTVTVIVGPQLPQPLLFQYHSLRGLSFYGDLDLLTQAVRFRLSLVLKTVGLFYDK